MSVAQDAQALGVRRATLSDLVNEKAALSPERALRIEKAFGLNIDMLLRLQTGYASATTRDQADEIDVRRFVPEEG